MNAKKCDRCGKFIDINEDYIGISIKHFSQGWESLPEDLDFCEDCAKELFKRGDYYETKQNKDSQIPRN